MTALPDFLGLVTSLAVLGLIVAGVMKLFQIGTELQQIKDILKADRGTLHPMMSLPQAPVVYAVPSPPVSAHPVPASEAGSTSGVSALAAALPQPPPYTAPAVEPPPPAMRGVHFDRPPTPEELVRAIHAQDFKGDDFPL